MLTAKCIYPIFLVSLASALLMSEAHAGLLNRLLLMMMRNRRRHYVPFPVSLSPFGNFGSSLGGGYYPYSLSSLAANTIAPSIPYSQYLASLANYGGLSPIAPLGPWGGINPYYLNPASYLNPLGDYPDYRSLAAMQNYLPLPSYTPTPIYTPPVIPAFPAAFNVSDNKDDKKLSTRAAAAAGLAYNIQGQDRKELLTKLKYLANHRTGPNYRSPILFPETDELIDGLR